jgi:hypothetical protein
MNSLLRALLAAVMSVDDPDARERERRRLVIRAEQEEAWRYGFYLDAGAR